MAGRHPPPPLNGSSVPRSKLHRIQRSRACYAGAASILLSSSKPIFAITLDGRTVGELRRKANRRGTARGLGHCLPHVGRQYRSHERALGRNRQHSVGIASGPYAMKTCLSGSTAQRQSMGRFPPGPHRGEGSGTTPSRPAAGPGHRPPTAVRHRRDRRRLAPALSRSVEK
jgi:hypothetical protein